MPGGTERCRAQSPEEQSDPGDREIIKGIPLFGMNSRTSALQPRVQRHERGNAVTDPRRLWVGRAKNSRAECSRRGAPSGSDPPADPTYRTRRRADSVPVDFFGAAGTVN